ncbi:hypothetical protein HJC23_012831 [Cyclotella cryptica]|uniref:Uncharacterized protein n=1 Tax=Cyclotella cryptica TaxID=29204 RepID=A0ABD3NZ14_9STRA|eukprot:CCRYP_018813-RA/>CCRYP_018813-RA protein AED:0.16 eAED:-0.04 QI:0/-1/0/1/-1/1/1/0/197
MKMDSIELNEASASRRYFLGVSIASTMSTSSFRPSIANAAYGEDARIVIPDIVQGISDRTNKQCLVESLGNRECLVYLDTENQLYKGSDGKILFERLAQSVEAMKNIPNYVEMKQWSKVESILTGKMGNLSSTMSELVKIIKDDSVKDKCKALSIDIRNDLYAVASSCSRKQQADALKNYKKAVLKLETFVALVNGL